MDVDKDKNVVEKLVGKINDVVDKVVTTASEAAQHAMEAEAKNMTGQPAAYERVASESFISDPMVPPAMMASAPKKRRPARKKTKPRARKAVKKLIKKTSKKSKKSAARKSEKSAKTTAGKPRGATKMRKKLSR